MVLFLFVFVVPRWFVPARSAASLAGVEDPAARGRLEDDRLKLQNDVRIGLLQAVAGVAVIAAVVVTWQQLETDRRQLRQQLEVAGQEQAGERFAQALDQLGSEQLDVRLGGIYGLERVAAPGRRGLPPAGGGRAALGLLVLPGSGPGVRDPVRLCPDDLAPAAGRARRVARGPPGTQADVNAAVTVLARRAVLAGDPPLDLSGSLLAGARLGWARLAGADLRGADLRGTSLQHAQLAGTNLEESLLCGAQLQGADLAGANLAGARATVATAWPDGFDWRAAGVRLVGSCVGAEPSSA